MFEGFIPNYSCSLHARDVEGGVIEIQFFSQYTPGQVIEKVKDYWIYDLIKFSDFPTPQRFTWGNKKIFHPLTQKEYFVIYNEVANES